MNRENISTFIKSVRNIIYHTPGKTSPKLVAESANWELWNSCIQYTHLPGSQSHEYIIC